LEEHTTKLSRQRELVLQIVRSTKMHPTAEDVYYEAKKKMPKISMGTVYRNLNLLSKLGRIKEISFPNSPARFDGDMRDHYHIRCSECGRIDDISHFSPRAAVDEIEKLTMYQIHTVHIKYEGICPECQKKSKIS